jgi:putative endonuclease
MFYVYIIKSLIKNWIYVGNTSNVENRIKEHNSGSVSSTKPYRPFAVTFVQEVKTREEARELEKYLKVKWNKESLLELIQ